MALVSQQIPSYKGGVSQQPAILRYPDQVEELINGFPSEVEGLQKRPPTEHIAFLGDAVSNNAQFHIINRDDDEQYILEMTKGALRVWDLKTGAPKTVRIEQDADYLNTDNPQVDLRAVTVADYTFILNRKKTVKMSNSKTSNGYQGTTLMYIKNAQYAKVYSLWYKGAFQYGVLTPDGGEAKQAVQTSTSFITRGLYRLAHDQQNATIRDFDTLVNQTGGASNMVYAEAVGAGSGVTTPAMVQYGDSVLSLPNHDWDIKDSFGGQNAYAIKNYVTAVTKLPTVAPDGYKVHVKGQTSSNDDDYWLEWQSLKDSWVESSGPDLLNSFDASTMPHALIRNADGTFSFKRLEWTKRVVGDDDSNPLPSFVDHTINDIFFYRNRLGFVSEENIILSASSDFFNFWFNSALSVEDTDPIDVAISDNRVSIIDAAVPFSRELMLFSKEGQFVLSAEGVLTPKSVGVDKITAFDYSDTARPISVGQSIFFMNDRVDHSSLMRFYTVQDVADLKDAEDVSAHIPTYIPVGINHLTGNTKDNIVLLTSKTETNTVYLYKFIISNSQSVQESWCKWYLGPSNAEILMAECVDSYIYFIIKTSNNLYLERMIFRGTAKDYLDEPYRLYMDRKTKFKVTNAKYDEYLGTTTVNVTAIYGKLPADSDAEYYFVDTYGYVIPVKLNSEWVILDGDCRGKEYFVGRKFEFEVVLSQQLIHQSDDKGFTSEDEGRLQLRYYWINYANSGVFNAIVKNTLTKFTYSNLSTNRYLGRVDNKLGLNILFTDKFKFPVQSNASETQITFYSDSPQPLVLISGGFEGYYYRRNQKV